MRGGADLSDAANPAAGGVTRRPFKRAPEGERRHDLIRATLDCVADLGLQGATVREIALRAGVTNGLIRHYFTGKDQMIHAAYRETMTGMTETAKAAVEDMAHAPNERLAHFIRANLTAPVVDPRTLSLWAAFVSMIRVDPEMAAIHREGYLDFRREVEELVIDVFEASGKPIAKADAERLAIKINAIIDGLWLEGCMAGDMFDENELVAVGIEAVEATVGMPLRGERK